VVAKVRERLGVNKQTTYRVHMGGSISNRFAALENLHAEVDINRALGTIRENIKISPKESLGYYELKKHKPWFDEGCLELLDQRKQTRLQ
jgi:hypothetical protein